MMVVLDSALDGTRRDLTNRSTYVGRLVHRKPVLLPMVWSIEVFARFEQFVSPVASGICAPAALTWARPRATVNISRVPSKCASLARMAPG